MKLCDGLTIKEIAYDLAICEPNVSTCKTRIMEKMGVDSVIKVSFL